MPAGLGGVVAVEGADECGETGCSRSLPSFSRSQTVDRRAVEVAPAEVEGALAAGAGLEVEPDEQQVEVGSRLVVRTASIELGDLMVVEGAAAAAGAAGLGERGGGFAVEEAGGDGPCEQGPQGGDAGLPRRPAGAVGVAGVGPGRRRPRRRRPGRRW